MLKEPVVQLLEALALALRKAGDPNRARAYFRAADAVRAHPDFDALLEAGRIDEVAGVGPSIARTIQAFYDTGEVPAWLAAPQDEAPDDVSSIPKSYREAPFPDAPDLHCHTTWSDGELSVEEVVVLAKRLGMPAIGISDHSLGLRVAHGLDEATLRKQWEEIARVQREHPDIRILRGTECDIHRDGTLDYPDALLKEFDYVIASIHSDLRLEEKEQTARLLRAIDHEAVTIIGHPTTRRIGQRPPGHLDLPKVFRRAADRDVALEVNGSAGRLDLEPKLARQALAAGAKLALGSDAHAAREHLWFAKAREMAAEAGATKDQIVNFSL